MSIAATTSSPEPVAHARPAQADLGPKASAPKKEVPRRKRRLLAPLLIAAAVLALAAGGGWYWWQEQLRALPPGIAKANGRLEAERVEIATKYHGRIATVLAVEGQMVDTGEVVARMDTRELEAQFRAAEAQVVRAQHEKTLADAKIAQRLSERTFAQQELARAAELQARGHGTVEMHDRRRSEMKTAQAAYDASIADLNAAVATIAARQAEAARLKSQLDDSVLVAPKRGRIQYKLAQPGEVLQSGGRVLTLIDLSDVYLTIFVPARVAGPLALGDEARVVLDPLPGYVFPAKITFVATEAQFTPKMVETAEEREKLMFRVKLTIDPELRPKYESQVKTGLRGVGYVRSDRNVEWPQTLAVKLP
jgi:HlyD family secretion protein